MLILVWWSNYARFINLATVPQIYSNVLDLINSLRINWQIDMKSLVRRKNLNVLIHCDWNVVKRQVLWREYPKIHSEWSFCIIYSNYYTYNWRFEGVHFRCKGTRYSHSRTNSCTIQKDPDSMKMCLQTKIVSIITISINFLLNSSGKIIYHLCDNAPAEFLARHFELWSSKKLALEYSELSLI